MSNLCNNCHGKNDDPLYQACSKCREKWRRAKSKSNRDFWLCFFKSYDGTIISTISGCNPLGDVRHVPGYIGFKKISVNIEALKK